MHPDAASVGRGLQPSCPTQDTVGCACLSPLLPMPVPRLGAGGQRMLSEGGEGKAKWY